MKPYRVLLAVEEASALQRRLEAKCARMPALAHPEHFKPLGSSAANTSYGASA